MDELDGNGVAGMLRDVFGTEMTNVAATCASCGAVAPVGESAVYTGGPGTVIRCRTCAAVLAVITQIRGMNCVDLMGVRALRGMVLAKGLVSDYAKLDVHRCHKAVERAGTLSHPGIEHPAVAVRVGTDQLRLVGQVPVAGPDRAGDGRDQVAYALGRLDVAAGKLAGGNAPHASVR